MAADEGSPGELAIGVTMPTGRKGATFAATAGAGAGLSTLRAAGNTIGAGAGACMLNAETGCCSGAGAGACMLAEDTAMGIWAGAGAGALSAAAGCSIGAGAGACVLMAGKGA